MVRIVTESTADIPAELVRQLDITVVPSYVVFGTQSYRDGVELTSSQFYEKLAASPTIPTTATPPPEVYEQAYHELGETTNQIVSIHLASRLSGLCQVAAVAAERLPELQIAVIDSEQVTMGYGWMAVAAAEAAQNGSSWEKTIALVESMKDRSHVLAALDTLEYLHRGGRVSWARAALGTLLRIKPLIAVRRGEVRLVERVRTWRRAEGRLLRHVEMIGKLERAVVLHANAPERAKLIAQGLRTMLPDWEPLTCPAGVTIASHAGPGAVGIACVAAA
jgi:DegV family protein with EDD domain